MPLGILNNLNPVNRDHMLASGLVSWHLALPHFASTQKWQDLGNAQNTALFSAATWTTSVRPGGYGAAATFNGTSAFIAASSILMPVGAGVPITAAFWCMSTNLTGFRTPYFYGGTTTGRGLLFAQDGTSNDGTIDVGVVGSNFLSSTKKLVVNTWTHIGLSYDGTTARLYINGVLDSSAAASINPPGAGFYNFGTYDQASQFWLGALDDIRTYWRPLSGTEMKELYDNSLLGCPGLLNFFQPQLASFPIGPIVTTYGPEVTAGPPIRGTPWFKTFPPRAPSIPVQVVSQASPMTAPEVHQGPPFPSPWFKITVAPVQIQAAPPPMIVQNYGPEVHGGPPLRGAPWLQLLPVQPTVNQAVVVQPLVTAPQSYAAEVHGGPPMPGAPWFHLPIAPPSDPGGKPFVPPPVPAGKGHGFTLIRRDPTLGSDPGRRSLDILTMIINSLISQGILVQTGVESWTIKTTSAPGSGLTGTFTSGTHP